MCRIPLIEDYLEPPPLTDLIRGQEPTIEEPAEVNQEEHVDDHGEEREIVSYDIPPPLPLEVYSDYVEFMNRGPDYENSPMPHANCQTIYDEDKCDFCEHRFMYDDLRMCYRCLNDFCSTCALPVNVSVLQCCNYHNLVLWFCSPVCREGLTRATVRAVHNVKTPCV